MHVLDTNYANLQNELNIIKSTLPIHGVCPICLKHFKGLKIHFNSCFIKNQSANVQPIDSPSNQSSVEQDSSPISASQVPEIAYEYENYDFAKQKWKCQFCNNYYKDLKSKHYANHLKAKHSNQSVSDFTKLFNESFFDPDTVSSSNIEVDSNTDLVENPLWLNNIRKLSIDKRFNVLHINVNSIMGSVKLIGIESILNASFVDILCVQETKIGSDTPDSFFEYLNYNVFRRDRIRGGGGILVFVKKCHKVLSNVNDDIFETIKLSIKLKNKIVDFIFSYNPHFEFSNEYLKHLEEQIKLISPLRSSFIIGDLNHDLLTKNSDNLKSLMLDYNFTTLIDSPTHRMGNSASSIDIVFFNTADSILNSTVVPCPFSNHDFVLSTLNFETNCSNTIANINTRVLNPKALDSIRDELSALNFSVVNNYENVDERWHVIKRIIVSIVDKFAPIKSMRPKKRDRYPWVDAELHFHLALRDKLYAIAIDSNTNRLDSMEWTKFRAQRGTTQKMFRAKMTEYFREKCCTNFKSSKKYWAFYKSVVKTKKSVASKSVNSINTNGTTVFDQDKIANAFNNHFANLGKANEFCSLESRIKINDNFLQYKRENLLRVDGSFHFNTTTATEIIVWIGQLDSASSAGVSGIPTKVIKHSAAQISTILAELFNYCLQACALPNEFKSAIVNPLFKGKGDCASLDDYRGICCLPPIAKVFERILNQQIVSYFESNNLFCANQHGFRANHSCETALISIIDHWKNAINNKEINLALFIDFKKAFDFVNHDLLLLKLFHYGFDNDSLALVRNYFQNRSQVTKLEKYVSSPADILLGAPQGSALSGTWFDIFINDAGFLCQLYAILFADDTTLSESNSSVEQLVSKFKTRLEPVLNWTTANQMFINWNKTKFMFIHNKNNVFLPNEILIGKEKVEVVHSFKLLGIVIDEYLNFKSYINALKKSVNIKLYSIKKLFFLSKNVKSHFFKAFIQPHFDYCAALAIYLNKTQLNSIEKFQKVVLFRLLNVRLFGLDHVNQKLLLNDFKLMPYKMRLCFRLSIFCHKVTNKLILPILGNGLSFKVNCCNLDGCNSQCRRKKEIVDVPDIRTDFCRRSFGYFLPKYINCVIKENYLLNVKSFYSYLSKNIDTIFEAFFRLFL